MLGGANRRTAPGIIFAFALAGLLAGCGDSSGDGVASAATQSCMTCHNGSQENDYGGPGLENPHPYGTGAQANLLCTTCHGGDPSEFDVVASHVPPPPEIGDDAQLIADAHAYFNRLTLAGIDKFPNYTVGGHTYSALDYLQFINPGDLRVVTQGRSCGLCHAPHAGSVATSMLATEVGILAGSSYAAGIDNYVAASVDLYEDTAGDLGFRAVQDPAFTFDPDVVGPVSELLEFPVISQFGVTGPSQLFNNPAYDSAVIASGQNPDGSLIAGSPLANLYHEQVAFTCGDCHLGSAGANNRYGDYRSSGCTACHMRYTQSGRSTTGDPNVDPFEPIDTDDIDAPERSHPARHLIRSIAKTLPGGEQVEGIDDYTCVDCHQGSNRTVLQYWGIRLDQNANVVTGEQYPRQPADFETTHNDQRLFDPVIGNHTFNGRNGNQYLLEEDYDGDNRDDTPPDVHYEAGLGCIDCHGSWDLHGGDVADVTIRTRMEHGVAIACENCHGTISAYATTTSGTLYDGTPAQVAVDSKGNEQQHVWRDTQGYYWLKSRLTGDVHFLPQTKDTVDDNGRTNQLTGVPIYNAKASYAMGRVDGDSTNGMGPLQTDGSATVGFAHGDSMSCVACHAAWENNCIGCHLEGEYNTNPANNSNITGERIVYRQRNADFVYQNPVLFQLGVNAHDKIAPISPNTEAFYTWWDQQGDESQTFTFSDRNGMGSSTAVTQHPSMSHNLIMPHSIRGRVDGDDEGPRYCNACHLTENAIANWGTEYATFRTAIQNDNYGALDWNLLATHIGSNTNNDMDSPFFVHMASGLGTGLFLFDIKGCPVNPVDGDDDRIGCDGISPQDKFNLANVVKSLDRLVLEDGQATGSSNHSLLDVSGGGSTLRDGAANPTQTGPLGATLLQRLTDPALGLVLDSWLDSDAQPQGDAGGFVGP